MMMTRSLRMVLLAVVLVILLLPAAAFAEETPTAGEKPAWETAWQVRAAMAIAGGLAMGLSALGAGMAQGKIGAAAAGALAERPELFTNVLVFLVLPEIIVLLGFVVAMLLRP